MVIKNRIKEVREALGITQEQLAYKSGVTVTTVSLVENMKVEPKSQTMIKICKVLGKNIGEVFYSEEEGGGVQI